MKSNLMIKGLLLLTAFISLFFVFFFIENLHCTQNSSFLIATFDMQPHVEETSPRLVYQMPFAPLLRAYLSSSLLLFLLYPSFSCTLFLRGKLSPIRYLTIGGFVFLLIGINMRLPIEIVGERYEALNSSAIYMGVCLYFLSSLAAIVYSIKERSIRSGI